MRSQIETQVRKAKPDASDTELEAIIERSVKASLEASGAAGKAAEEKHQGIFSHELGHIFFINSFWPNNTVDFMSHNMNTVNEYGGPAADWLDEIAAVMLENASLTVGREKALEQAATSGDFSALWPLEEFFTMVHPAFEEAKERIRQRAKTAKGKAKGGVVVLKASDMKKRADGRESVTFYSQARGFAEFMMSRTGEQTIFENIAEFAARGGDMDAWLLKYGQQLGLADTVTGLEIQFHAFLKQRYADGGTTAR